MGILDAPAIPRDLTGTKLSSIAVGRLLRQKITAADAPTVAASPPAIAVSASGAATSITSAVNVPVILNPSGAWSINPKFTTFGLPLVPAVATSFKANPNTPTAMFSATTPSTLIEFTYAGSKLEFQIVGANARGTYRLYINGQRETLRARTSPGSDSGIYLVSVTFAAAGVYRVGLELSHNLQIVGVNIGPTDTLLPTVKRRAARLYAVTDSFGDGSTTGSALTALDTYPSTLAAMLGIQDLYLNGVGGTGWLNAGSQSTYGPRITADIAAWTGDAPDIVLLQGTVNDGAAAAANSTNLVTAVQASITAVRAAWPHALLVVTGNIRPSAPLGGNDLTVNTAMISAASTAADLFIDASAEGWFSGLGHVGATTGTGNADVMDSSDATHPTQLGADYIASRIARDILNWVNAL